MIEDWLERKQVCICAGSGGVGKTTASAAIIRASALSPARSSARTMW